MNNYCNHSNNVTTCSQCSCKHGILWEDRCDECEYDYDQWNAQQEADHYANLDSIDREEEDRQWYRDNPDLCPHFFASYDYCDICDRED